MIEVPSGVLPPPGRRAMPAPIPLRAMLGPSIILAGLSIGSGEFVLWPRITAEWGFAVFWACWVGVTIQFFLNMEIERWTLATGESAVTGFFRLGRVFGFVFLLGGSLPWIWPGWATGAGQLIVWEVGGNVTFYAVAGLVLCGVILSASPVVYRTVERLQFVLVGGIFISLVILVALVVRADALTALFAGALAVGQIPEGIHLPTLLGALAFAGAGGTVNLAQSNYIKDKGYGMGAWIGRITSPFTGRYEAAENTGFVFEATEENLARWRIWWRRTNLEHFFSFYVLCVLSLALCCLLTYSLLEPGASVSPGLGFIEDQALRLEARFGSAGRHLFLGAGIAVLFSTELALLDAVSRVLADLVKVSLFRDREIGLSRIYFGILWLMIGFGIAVLAIGLDQPWLLLVISAALNGFVMFVYAGLLLWLNLRTFRGELRPGFVRCGALVTAVLFFGYFSVQALRDQLSRL